MRHLTFDIDWAPDWCVEDILDLLNNYKVKATFFITHPSPTIERISSEGHEVGLHPNFLPGSSHGGSVKEIMEYGLRLYPNARVIRAHGLVQSSHLLETIFTEFSSLQYDLSQYAHALPSPVMTKWKYNQADFHRITYNWEDDFYFYHPKFLWDGSGIPGDVIFDFHPIHIALNSNGPAQYSALKSETQNEALFSLSRDRVEGFRNNGGGSSTMLKAVLESGDFSTFEETAQMLSQRSDHLT